ncbi:MAG: hypothetical protein QXK06_04695 [Candidatus Diapherotrites archaeon]
MNCSQILKVVMQKIDALRKELIKKTKRQVLEHYTGRDVHIIRAINVLEDIDFVFNLLFEDVREWYSVHFPELEKIVKGNETFLALVAELCERSKFSEQNILTVYQNKEMAKKIAEAAQKSVGSPLEEKDCLRIQKLADKAIGLKKQRNALASYIESEMNTQMPNFSKIAGPLLGARLLNAAGSLKRLAMMPSSTIQVMGAEKALFQHLKTGSKPPKHGFIFQHPLMRSVKRKNRGKIARALANKLSLAAKEDYFGRKDTGDKMLEALEKRAQELK